MKKEQTHKESIQELIGLGAHELIKLRDLNEFKIPEDFKSSLHDKVLNTIDREEFKIPTNFFAHSQAQVLNQIPKEKSITTTKFRMFNWALPLVAAAVLAFVFFLPEEDNDCVSFDCLLAQTELTQTDFELLLSEGNDLLELIETDELFIDISQDETLEYLLESDYDIEELW